MDLSAKEQLLLYCLYDWSASRQAITFLASVTLLLRPYFASVVLVHYVVLVLAPSS